VIWYAAPAKSDRRRGIPTRTTALPWRCISCALSTHRQMRMA